MTCFHFDFSIYFDILNYSGFYIYHNLPNCLLPVLQRLRCSSNWYYFLDDLLRHDPSQNFGFDIITGAAYYFNRHRDHIIGFDYVRGAAYYFSRHMDQWVLRVAQTQTISVIEYFTS